MPSPGNVERPEDTEVSDEIKFTEGKFVGI